MHTLRQLAKSPLFTSVSVLTLALGLGVNAAIFALVRSILLRDLPYPQPQELVTLSLADPSGAGQPHGVTGPEFRHLAETSRTLKGAAGYAGWSFLLYGTEQASLERGAYVSGEFFSVLGVQPVQGRTLTPADDRLDAPLAAVVGEAFWRRKLGGRSEAIGSTLLLGDQAATVVGILPDGFHFADQAEIFLPLAHNSYAANARVRLFDVIGRLAPGLTASQASAEAGPLLAEFARRTDYSLNERVPLVRSLHEENVARARPALLSIQAAGGLLLAATFATLLLLMFARNSAREREFCVRLALGASRAALARIILAESVAIALAGGALGVLLAWWTLDGLLALAPEGLLPRRPEIGFDAGALLFAVALMAAGALVFGLISAWRRRERDLNEVLKRGGRSVAAANPRSRQALVMAEIALAIVLLSSVALLGRSLVRLLQVQPGFDPANLVAVRVTTGGERYATPAQRAAFYRELERRFLAVPGVGAVGAVNRLPFLEGGPDNNRANVTTRLFIEGRDYGPGNAGGDETDYRVASPEYFATMRIPLRAGRLFTWDEANSGQDVIVINEAAARRYWPGEDPVGQRVKFSLANADTPWLQVIGVVGDVRHFNLELVPRPEIYRPYLVNPMTAPNLALRVTRQPEAVVPLLRAALRELDPGLAPSGFATMAELVQRSHAQRRFLLLMLGAFGGLTLLLATLGLYGVVSQYVIDRRFEFATRAALGASPRDLIRHVLGRWTAIAVPGLIAGTLGALAAGRLIAGLLYGTSAYDPAALFGAIALIAAIALLACLLPAQRAAKADPMTALRAE